LRAIAASRDSSSGRVALQHPDAHGDEREVLGETVVEVARDPPALLQHRYVG
jgi:hypothetical protein